MDSNIISEGSTTIKPTTYPNRKLQGNNSMSSKGNKVITRITKKLPQG